MPEAPLDKDALFELVDEDPEFLQQLIQTFQADCSVYMEAIRQAVDDRDADALIREAHGLKGAVANLQAESAQQAAHRLEEIGRNDRLDEAPSALKDLEDEIRRLRSALTDLTNEL
jgi:HPt (histidine-containing phosphotransfer) domain-containing protein